MDRLRSDIGNKDSKYRQDEDFQRNFIQNFDR